MAKVLNKLEFLKFDIRFFANTFEKHNIKEFRFIGN